MDLHVASTYIYGCVPQSAFFAARAFSEAGTSEAAKGTSGKCNHVDSHRSLEAEMQTRPLTLHEKAILGSPRLAKSRANSS